MERSSHNADALVQQIDAGTLRPKGNAVARALLKKIGFQHEIITRYDCGDLIERRRGSDPLWQQINALPVDQQGSLRLVASLARPESELDWYEAEFFIEWARQEGVSEVGIAEAFGVCVSDS